MTAVMIDSNVLLDVMTEDARWFSWSADVMERAADNARLVINPIIYAEVSTLYARIEDLEVALPKAMIDREAIPYRSEEHTSELQSLMRISYAVFCLKKKKN